MVPKRSRRLMVGFAAAVACAVVVGCGAVVAGTPVGPGRVSDQLTATSPEAQNSSEDAQDTTEAGRESGPGRAPESAGDSDSDGGGPGEMGDLESGDWSNSSLDSSLLLPPENVSTTWDVVPKKDSVILGYDAVEQLLINYDATAGRWEFHPGAVEAAGLKEGGTLLVAGRGIGRITSISDEGGRTVVKTGEASLADVIEEGEFSWDATVGFGEQWLVDDTPQGLRSPRMAGIFTVDDAGRAHEARPRVTPLGTLAWEFEQEGIEYTFSVDAGPDSAKVAIQAKRDGMTYTAKGTLGALSAVGSAKYSGGELTESNVRQNSLAAKLDLSVATAGGGKKEFSFTMPGIMFKYLIPVGPVPLTLSVSVQVVGSVMAINEASATFKSSYSYAADTGFQMKRGQVEATGVFTQLTMDADPADPAAMIGNNVDAQFGVGYPRVSLSFFDIGFIPFVQPAVLLGTSLTWGPVCKKAYVRAEIGYGYDFKILGVSLAKHDGKIEGERKDAKGDSCG